MTSLTQELYDELAGDEELVRMLATYRGAPAIFTDLIPEDAKLPFVFIAPPESDDDYGYKNLEGRDLRRQVRAFTSSRTSPLVVEAIAHRVRSLLHRRPLGPAYVADVEGPMSAPTSPDIHGRTLRVRFLTTA